MVHRVHVCGRRGGKTNTTQVRRQRITRPRSIQCKTVILKHSCSVIQAENKASGSQQRAADSCRLFPASWRWSWLIPADEQQQDQRYATTRSTREACSRAGDLLAPSAKMPDRGTSLGEGLPLPARSL